MDLGNGHVLYSYELSKKAPASCICQLGHDVMCDDSVEKCASIKFIGLTPFDWNERIEKQVGKKTFLRSPTPEPRLEIYGQRTGIPLNRYFVDGKKFKSFFLRNVFFFSLWCWVRPSKPNILITANRRTKKKKTISFDKNPAFLHKWLWKMCPYSGSCSQKE